MDNPQYRKKEDADAQYQSYGFKPYYKWITLNTHMNYRCILF